MAGICQSGGPAHPTGHLEEAIMHEVPGCRAFCCAIVDPRPYYAGAVAGLVRIRTIIGMFNAFHVLADAQSGAAQITGGIARSLDRPPPPAC